MNNPSGILWLTDEQAQAITRHARDEAPREACGLIAGVGSQARRIFPIPNVAERPNEAYRMDGPAFVRAFYEFEAAGLSLIGIYHSHPSSDPIPSPVDIAQAAYPDVPYLIVGLKHNEPRLATWQIRHGRVDALDLQITPDGIAPLYPTEPEHLPLSPAQRAAILASALIALTLMLVMALSLLPSPHMATIGR
ncbi:MAG: M67 family metallopeptidase [Burkholderiales bacterium]|nr:M67 family metallopeptidase [Anaerolineae bacterium]